jgi:hypothetical protein
LNYETGEGASDADGGPAVSHIELIPEIVVYTMFNAHVKDYPHK